MNGLDSVNSDWINLLFLLTPKNVVDKDEDLHWDLISDRETKPTAKWDGHEIYIEGDFGSVTYHQGHVANEFHATKLTFKNKPEHQLSAAKMEL